MYMKLTDLCNTEMALCKPDHSREDNRSHNL